MDMMCLVSVIPRLAKKMNKLLKKKRIRRGKKK